MISKGRAIGLLLSPTFIFSSCEIDTSLSLAHRIPITVTMPGNGTLSPLAVVGHRPLKYLDILVDGRPLAHFFAGRLGAAPDSISPLGPLESGMEQYRREQFERFLLERKPDLPDGRNSILVCPLCGDLGCDAHSARFQR